MDGRKHAIATERNREPILKVLLEVLPSTGTILEIASGTGEHAAYFAPRLKPRKWIPSDINPSLHESIIAWIRHSPSENLYQPLKIDASQPVWKVETQELLENIRHCCDGEYKYDSYFTLVCLFGINGCCWTYSSTRRNIIFIRTV